VLCSEAAGDLYDRIYGTLFYQYVFGFAFLTRQYARKAGQPRVLGGKGVHRIPRRVCRPIRRSMLNARRGARQNQSRSASDRPVAPGRRNTMRSATDSLSLGRAWNGQTDRRVLDRNGMFPARTTDQLAEYRVRIVFSKALRFRSQPWLRIEVNVSGSNCRTTSGNQPGPQTDSGR